MRKPNRKQKQHSGIKSGQIIETEISGLAYGGYGVGKSAQGVLFVHRGVPGDRVKVNVTRGKKRFGSGEIGTLISPSSNRIDPKCSAFESGCGGCQWLHMKYGLQAEWKERIVRETLKRIGKVNSKVLPVIRTKSPYFNRNKMSLQLDLKKNVCGFMVENSRKIINFETCRCVTAVNQNVYQIISTAVESPQWTLDLSQIHIRSNKAGEWGVCIYGEASVKDVREFSREVFGDHPDCQGVAYYHNRQFDHIMGQPFIEEQLNGVLYQIPHGSFFQTNYLQAEVLQVLAEKYLDPSKNDTILDLFCGSGLFALHLAQQCKSVFGIENNKASIQYAEENSRNNDISNTDFKTADVETALLNCKTGAWNKVVLDPPRAGCTPEVIHEVVRINPEKILYISCAPDTLARDLFLFIQEGYEVDYCQPVDMFPNTYHVEVAAGLRKR